MTLVVLAAGLGSRYGGLKQLDSVGENGEIIIDYSVYDALRAGYEKVVFVIKEENLSLFRSSIGARIEKHTDVDYVFQKNDVICAKRTLPARKKPWGTGFALASCKGHVKGSFSVVNADDFYGKNAFATIKEYLDAHKDENSYCMAGYILENTLSASGSVSRGVCSADKNGFLTGITEHTDIRRDGNKILSADGERTQLLPADSIVSMNFYGFNDSFINFAYEGFERFLLETKNPETEEYYLPTAVKNGIESGFCSVKVLKTEDKWYGITYREDKPMVVKSLARLTEKGFYPKQLWT